MIDDSFLWVCVNLLLFFSSSFWRGDKVGRALCVAQAESGPMVETLERTMSAILFGWCLGGNEEWIKATFSS
jgi:hypothetical protein